MSSRLFQEIREKNGLAYSVYTYNQYYLSGGLTSTYIELIWKVMKKL